MNGIIKSIEEQIELLTGVMGRSLVNDDMSGYKKQTESLDILVRLHLDVKRNS
jgi:hypothetical protein